MSWDINTQSLLLISATNLYYLDMESFKTCHLLLIMTVSAVCRLSVVAVDANQRVVGDMTGDLLVQDELRSGDATLLLSDSDGKELERWTASPGLPLPDDIHLDISQELKVACWLGLLRFPLSAL